MLCSWFPNRVQPTNGNFVEKHIRLLAPHYRIQVLQVEYDPNLSLGQTEWLSTTANGFELLTIYFGGKTGRIGRTLIRLSLFWKAFSYLRKQHSFDLVHVHVAMPAVLLPYLWSKLYQLPFVLSCHSSGFLDSNPKPYPNWQKRLLVTAANRAKFVCPVSVALGQAWQKNGLRAPIRVIPNVVNTRLFCPAKPPPSPPLLLLHISNFHPEAKNVEGILRVAKRLADKDFPFHLTIAGDGDLQRITSYARQLGLNSEHLTCRGTLIEEQVAQQMQTHHVFLLFSNYETQGVTLLEALCCGLPVIATRVGGIPEIVNDPQKGVLIEPGDEDALEAAILEFKVNRTGQSEESRRKYGHDGVSALLRDLYEAAS